LRVAYCFLRSRRGTGVVGGALIVVTRLRYTSPRLTSSDLAQA
jgi:hypothetical protein